MNRTPNQQRASNISQHICVTAGAGSGKTTVLVDRYLKILQGGVTPRDIVAITFTEKAAAEMKGRVIENLKDATDLKNREQCLEEMNIAPISTIHAFCSRILREFPFQAGVPANFGVLRGIDQTLLLRHTIKNTLQDIATNTDDEHHTELHCSLQRYGNRQKLTTILHHGRET
jgi:ATP-dependent helicase/nuclease subunit A